MMMPTTSRPRHAGGAFMNAFPVRSCRATRFGRLDRVSATNSYVPHPQWMCLHEMNVEGERGTTVAERSVGLVGKRRGYVLDDDVLRGSRGLRGAEDIGSTSAGSKMGLGGVTRRSDDAVSCICDGHEVTSVSRSRFCRAHHRFFRSRLIRLDSPESQSMK